MKNQPHLKKFYTYLKNINSSLTKITKQDFKDLENLENIEMSLIDIDDKLKHYVKVLNK